MERAELASWLRLALTPGVGNDTARKLMAAFGPPASLFEAPTAALLEYAGPLIATTWFWPTMETASP
jgi:DNA processing protein